MGSKFVPSCIWTPGSSCARSRKFFRSPEDFRLCLCENSLHRGLFGVDFHSACLNLDDLAFLTDLQSGVEGCGVPTITLRTGLTLLKPLAETWTLYCPGSKRAGCVGARGELEVNFITAFVAVFVTVTTAPPTTAPVGSFHSAGNTTRCQTVVLCLNC